MLGIPLGLLAANATEWVVHKYVLHGFGKEEDSYWRFHFREHHPKSLKNKMYDPHYERPGFDINSKTKELAALVGGCAAVAPLFPIAPFFVGTLWYSAYNYYRVHKRSHLDPEWAAENLPWHVAHHMTDPQANWCVTKPWFDKIMGTSTYESNPRWRDKL